MVDNRIRVSITLTQTEYDYLASCADVIGLPVTRVAYLAVNEGLPVVIDQEKRKMENVRNLRLAQSQVDWAMQDLPPAEKRGRGRPRKAK